MAGLEGLYGTLNTPRALKDYGLRGGDLEEAVRLILPAIPESNPRPVTEERLLELLTEALFGTTPGRVTCRGDVGWDPA